MTTLGFVVVERNNDDGGRSLSSTVLHPNAEGGEWERDVRVGGASGDPVVEAARYTVAAVVPKSAVLSAKPCGCAAPCGCLPYDRLSRGAAELGRRLDEMAEVMRDAIVVAHQCGPQAGMNQVVRYVASIPELRAGIEASCDHMGVDRG